MPVVAVIVYDTAVSSLWLAQRETINLGYLLLALLVDALCAYYVRLNSLKATLKAIDSKL